MAVVNKSTVVIRNSDNEAFNLGTVVANPRSASAVDIKAGLDNLIIEAPEGTPDLVIGVIKYLFQGYFAYAHQSGLYNRQIRLWEMFARISSVDVRQLERGFFSRYNLPVYELELKTSMNQSPVCALVIDQEVLNNNDYKGYATPGKVYVELLKDYIGKVMKMQARMGSNGVKGLFVVSPAPLAPELLAYIEKETGADDAVSRVESIWPSPVSAHVNLLTYSMEQEAPEASLIKQVISLAYPKIIRKAPALPL